MKDKTDSKKRIKTSDFKRIVSLAKPESKAILVGTLFLLIGGGMGLLYPKLIGWYMEEVVNKKSVSQINLLAFWMTIIVLVQGISIMLRSYLFTVAGERIVSNLRTSLFQKVVSQDIAFFDQRRTGELINRLSSDTATIQSAVSVNISMLLRFGLSTIGSLILLFFTSLQLTLLMLVIVPPVALGTVFFGRKIRKLAKNTQDALAEANNVAEESLSGIRTVRAFTHEKLSVEKYDKSVEHSFQLAKKRAYLGALFAGTVAFFAYAAIALVLWYGGKLVVGGKINVGDLTSFILYTLTIAISLGTLGTLWADFMRASGAAARVFELLDEEPSMPLSGGKKLDKVQGKIEFENVSFSYPTRKDIDVLDKIQFHLEPGEIVAIVGPSGSGKSTIASLICRLYDPVSGRILLDGQDISGLDPEWYRNNIGIVSQEPILFSTSIEENIQYGKEGATAEEVVEAAKMANAHNFIQQFPEKYQTAVGEKGAQLSGGQKQRVAIARAILRNPQILLLDEATSALDSQSESLVKEALDRLMQNRTTLIIAHRLSTVKDANRVFVMDQHKIVEQGTHEQLMEKGGLYKKLVETQLEL